MMLEEYRREQTLFDRHHTHPANILIHKIAVPLEFLSFYLLLLYVSGDSRGLVHLCSICLSVYMHVVSQTSTASLINIVLGIIANGRFVNVPLYS